MVNLANDWWRSRHCVVEQSPDAGLAAVHLGEPAAEVVAAAPIVSVQRRAAKAARSPQAEIYFNGRISTRFRYIVNAEVEVAKTLLDLDEGLLAEAAATLGTKTKKETVTLALQKVSEDARARRASALEDLLTVADDGGFDYDRLADLNQ